MSFVFLLPLLSVAAAIPSQYGGGPVTCETGTGCVDASICIDGVIDVYAGIDLRTKPTCASPNVCCKIPVEEPTYETCSASQGCVQEDLCINGKINTAGVGLIDLRFRGTSVTAQKSCYDEEAGVAGVCCEKPKDKIVKKCPTLHTCTPHSQCNEGGQIIEVVEGQTFAGPYLTGGVECKLPSDDPYSHNIGVCCKAKTYETCLPDETCVYEENCGFNSYDPLSTKRCQVPGTVAEGVCCKAEIPPCSATSYCTPNNYCNRHGFLVDAPHTEAFYADGDKCRLNTGETGVCCNLKPPGCDGGDFCTSPEECPHLGSVGYNEQPAKTCDYTTAYGSESGVCCPPPPKFDCGGDHVCTPVEYCDKDGVLAPAAVTDPYLGGNECSLPGDLSQPAVCCKIYVPRPPEECPVNSVCMHNAKTCPTGLLETGDIYSTYNTNKTYQTCASYDIGGGYCCNADLQCGQTPLAKPQITSQFYKDEVTPDQALFGEVPWQAIIFNQENTYKCGATLIDNKHLLTVAHCVNGDSPKNLRVRLGEWQINGFDEIFSYEDYNVEQVLVHPKYNARKVWNNIAILVLATPVKYNFHINRVCLPRDSYQFQPGHRCIISGWGKDSFGGSFRPILKKVDVPLVSFEKCQDQLRKTRLSSYFKLHKSYTCAGGEAGKDACTGDGGGPLFCYDKAIERYVLVGLTAWGIGCSEAGVPAVYTGINETKDFISQYVPDWDTGDIYL